MHFRRQLGQSEIAATDATVDHGGKDPRITPAQSRSREDPSAAEAIGTITLDDLPREQRENWPASGCWGVPVSALYVCDGRRNLAEVIRLTELEMGPQNFDFVGLFLISGEALVRGVRPLVGYILSSNQEGAHVRRCT
jgi:hypothetical protein